MSEQQTNSAHPIWDTTTDNGFLPNQEQEFEQMFQPSNEQHGSTLFSTFPPTHADMNFQYLAPEATDITEEIWREFIDMSVHNCSSILNMLPPTISQGNLEKQPFEAHNEMFDSDYLDSNLSDHGSVRTVHVANLNGGHDSEIQIPKNGTLSTKTACDLENNRTGDSMLSGFSVDTPESSTSALKRRRAAAPEAVLDEIVDDKWELFLFAWFDRSGRRQPSGEELESLSTLTKAPKLAIHRWFGSILCSGPPVSLEYKGKEKMLSINERSSEDRIPSSMAISTVHSAQKASGTIAEDPKFDILDGGVAKINENIMVEQHQTGLLRTISHPSLDTKIKEILAESAQGCPAIRKHERQHGKFHCTNGCDRRFPRSHEWVRHLKVTYPQEFWFCLRCGDPAAASADYLFTRRDKFRQHLTSSHNEWSVIDALKNCCVDFNAPFKRRCGFCDRNRFRGTSFDHWLQHVRNHFNKGMPFEQWRDWPEDALDGNEDGFNEGEDDSDDDHDNDDNQSDEGSRNDRTFDHVHRSREGRGRRVRPSSPLGTSKRLSSSWLGNADATYQRSDVKLGWTHNTNHTALRNHYRMFLKPKLQKTAEHPIWFWKGSSSPLASFSVQSILVQSCILGRGSYAWVDKIKVLPQGQCYARKTFGLASVRDRNYFCFRVLSEVECLQSMNHPHITKFVGAYLLGSLFSIVMEPVAETDLKHILEVPTMWPDLISNAPRFLCCLASALAYLHNQKRIIHHDVKPANIILQSGNVFLADFGLAAPMNETGPIRRMDLPTPMTPMYAPPEADSGGRYKPSYDIWSLACVFTEIITVSLGHTLRELHEFTWSNATGSSNPATYGSVAHRLHLWLSKLQLSSDSVMIQNILELTRSMINTESSKRPFAEQVRDEISSIFAHHNDYSTVLERCNLCRTSSEATVAVAHMQRGRNTSSNIQHNDPELKPSKFVKQSRDASFLHAQFLPELRACTRRAACGKTYVLTERLKAWLQQRDLEKPEQTNAELLLAEVHSVHESSSHSSTGRFKGAPYKCLPTVLMTFSVLIYLGRGSLIGNFIEGEISDDLLPLPKTRIQPLLNQTETLTAPEVENLTNVFFDAQWAFCPITFDLNSRGFYTDEKWIVPIRQMENLGNSDTTAKTALVWVEEQFVSHELQRATQQSPVSLDGYNLCYQFVLKTFKADQKDNFEAERDAWEPLRQISGIVHSFYSYAAFQSNEHQKEPSWTYNILFEYSQLDLPAFFQCQAPPIAFDEILHFWESLFDTSRALLTLDNFNCEQMRRANYVGWHPDIQPENILRVDREFRLAHPKFGPFETYSRPEEFQDHEKYSKMLGDSSCAFSSHTSHITAPELDFRSFGCVISMAATWVVHGASGVSQCKPLYNRSLRKTTEGSRSCQQYQVATGPHVGKSIRDGLSLRSVLQKWHEELHQNIRREDTITGKILDLVEELMFLDERHLNPQQNKATMLLQDLIRRLEMIFAKSIPVHLGVPSLRPDNVVISGVGFTSSGKAAIIRDLTEHEPPWNPSLDEVELDVSTQYSGKKKMCFVDRTARNANRGDSYKQCIACSACAKAKTKCDRQVPSCSRCKQRGIICEKRPPKQSNKAAFRLAREQLSRSRRPVRIAALPDALRSQSSTQHSDLELIASSQPIPAKPQPIETFKNVQSAPDRKYTII